MSDSLLWCVTRGLEEAPPPDSKARQDSLQDSEYHVYRTVDHPRPASARYIDDYAGICKHGWQVLKEFLAFMNIQHPSLSFTMEHG